MQLGAVPAMTMFTMGSNDVFEEEAVTEPAQVKVLSLSLIENERDPVAASSSIV